MSASLDRRARFEVVVSTVFEPLQRYLRRRLPTDDIEDVLAETLLTLWRRLDDVPDGDPLPWSYGVARRALANHRRARDRRLRLVDRVGREATVTMLQQPSIESESNDIEDERLAGAFDSLNRSDREILRLWAWEALEPREISTVLGLTPNAATIRLSRARRKLGVAMTRQIGVSSGHIQGEHREERSDG